MALGNLERISLAEFQLGGFVELLIQSLNVDDKQMIGFGWLDPVANQPVGYQEQSDMRRR